jgi:hypothetical protein
MMIVPRASHDSGLQRAIDRVARLRARLTSLAFAVAALITEPIAAQPVGPATFLPIAASVVRVEASRTQGGTSIGSGVAVAPSIIVTNCHVTRDAADIRVSAAGQVFQVTGQRADGTHDLCFLHVPGWQGKAVKIADGDDLRIGDPVAAIGFTGGTGKSLHLGRIRALHAVEGARIIQSDAAFTSGASGGGLFDHDGALVGLLTFRSRQLAGGFFALPVAWIRERLPRDDQWTDIGPLHDAAAFWQRDAVTQPFFMRAATLNAERRWTELIDLTATWAKAEPDDAEPFRVRGGAFQALDLGESAVFAFSEALRLEPNNPLSWYGLALAYASIGNTAASQEAELVTTNLDAELGSSLRDELAHLQRGR